VTYSGQEFCDGRREMRGNHVGRGHDSSVVGAADVVGIDDDGMSTVEYAIGTIAAAAFGAILYTVITGDSIVSALTNIINRALNTNV
jgi:hypothetical protein